jgi:periplasmic glucans biosynthesis protein
MSLVVPRIPALFVTVALTSAAICQTWEREDVGFKTIQSRARDLANKPYIAPAKDSLPGWMNNLSYDQYRDIRFNPNQALWAADKLPFRAMLFPPRLSLPRAGDAQRVHQKPPAADPPGRGVFQLWPARENHGELPPDGGFSRDSAFIRRSTTRMFSTNSSPSKVPATGARSAKTSATGLSSRGIAVDTGIDGMTEEFPGFPRVLAAETRPDDTHARFYALLDGPSYAGAYAFKISPGNETIVEVDAVFFARRAVGRLGIAPMSSMFWFGENSRRRFDDFRPEVHDSDGLAIRMGSGERIWRPVANDSGKLEFSFFAMDKCDGFGLLQRDRRFSRLRGWRGRLSPAPLAVDRAHIRLGRGPGDVDGNPDHQRTDRQHGGACGNPPTLRNPAIASSFPTASTGLMDPDPSQAVGHVVATRSGVHDWQPGQRTVVVEFAGPSPHGKSR